MTTICTLKIILDTSVRGCKNQKMQTNILWYKCSIVALLIMVTCKINTQHHAQDNLIKLLVEDILTFSNYTLFNCYLQWWLSDQHPITTTESSNQNGGIIGSTTHHDQ